MVAGGLLLAYHDRSDGGLFATLAEMAFGARHGLDVVLDGLDGEPIEILFNEEAGVVLQVADGDLEGCERHPGQARSRGSRPRDRPPQRGRCPHGAARGRGSLLRAGRRPRTPMVGADLPHAGAARQSRLRQGGVRRPPRRDRPRHDLPPRLRPGRDLPHRRRAAPDGDPPRAGHQRPGGDGRGLRPGRVRQHRRAHDRPPVRAHPPRRLRRARGLRRLLLRRRARGRFGLGQVRPFQRPPEGHVRRLLRAAGDLRPRRLQRLPDGQPAQGHHPPARATGPPSRATVRSSSRPAT